jgi:GAF domain-containing protein
VAADLSPPDPTAAALERLAGLVLSEQTLHSVLQTTADLTKQAMPGDTEVSVSLLVQHGPTTAVYTGQLALDLDERQYGRGHGPCLAAATERVPVEVTDARTEQRWPDYTERAVARGSLSSLSVPLTLPDLLSAALNIYAREANAFDDDSRRLAGRFAEAASASVANMYAYQSTRELADNLQIALASRAVIDQGKGILMERHKLSAEQAFDVLARISSLTNTKLREVADHLVRTGELPNSHGR